MPAIHPRCGPSAASSAHDALGLARRSAAAALLRLHTHRPIVHISVPNDIVGWSRDLFHQVLEVGLRQDWEQVCRLIRSLKKPKTQQHQTSRHGDGRSLVLSKESNARWKRCRSTLLQGDEPTMKEFRSGATPELLSTTVPRSVNSGVSMSTNQHIISSIKAKKALCPDGVSIATISAPGGIGTAF